MERAAELFKKASELQFQEKKPKEALILDTMPKTAFTGKMF